MRWWTGVLGALLWMHVPAAAEEPAPEPPGGAAPAWRVECEALQRRAMEAAERDDHAAAVELGRVSLSLLREHMPSSLELAGALQWLGVELFRAGRLEEAARCTGEALEIGRRLVPGDSPQVARHLGDHGHILLAQGRAAQALPWIEESVAMRQRLFPPDHAEVGAGLLDLGQALRRLGRPSDAVAHLERAVSIGRRHSAGDDMDVAVRLNAWGDALRDSGRAAEAVPPYEESLAMYRRLRPGDGDNVVDGLEKLASTLEDLDRPAHALPHREAAVAMHRRLHPGDRTDTVHRLTTLASVLDAAERRGDGLAWHVEALAMARRLQPGDHRDVAVLAHNLASALGSLGRVGEALPLHEEALAMHRRLVPGDHVELTWVLSGLASTLADLGRTEDALEAAEQSLAMSRRLFPGDDVLVAGRLAALGGILLEAGRPAEALAQLELALGMYRRLRATDGADAARTLDKMSGALLALGRATEALACSEESVEVLRREHPGDHPSVAAALDRWSLALDAAGRSEDALQASEESLAMTRRLHAGDHPSVAAGTSNMARILSNLGRVVEAHRLFEQALVMHERLYPGDHPRVAVASSNVGAALQRLGRGAEAVDVLRRALAMHRRLRPGGSWETALALTNLAAVLKDLGRAAEALPLDAEALTLCRELFPGDHPGVALSLNNLAHTYESLGRRTEGLALREEAYEMACRLGLDERRRYGTGLGKARLASGQTEAAKAPLEVAVESLELIRWHARGLRSEERSQFVGALRAWSDPYGLLLEAHVRLQEFGPALEVLERGRGREMLDALVRGTVDIVGLARRRSTSAGDEASVRNLEEALRARDAAEESLLRRSAALARPAPGGGSGGRRELLEAEGAARRDAMAAMSRVQRVVREVVPETVPLDSAAIQALLAPDELLLAYALGVDRSHAFLVGGELIQHVPLTSAGQPLTRDAVEHHVVAFRELLGKSGATPLEGVADAGHALFRLLIPEPLWAALLPAKRVYLVPHEALHGLPFETLVVERAEDGSPVHWADKGPLLAYEPSASILGFLRKRVTAPATGPTLVAVGDPAFVDPTTSGSPGWPVTGALVTEVRRGGPAESAGLRLGDVIVAYDGQEVTDARSLVALVGVADGARSDVLLAYVRDGERTEARITGARLGVGLATEPPSVAGPLLLARVSREVALPSAVRRSRRLRPLPGTRREVEAIGAAVRRARGDDAVMTLLGKDAREGRLFEEANRPQVLHLATHGLVDETETASFSSLALTMPRVPVTGDDGFLTLVDLFQRWTGRLEGTELVVLSACESVKGREQRDEPMFALPWGFLYAGARSVIGSLWKVDDAATAHLMQAFYERWLGGLEPLEALAAARRETRATYPHPAYWGAFVFSGAPR